MQTAKQEPLAKTGLSSRRLISAEYGLQVTSEKHMALWQTFHKANTGAKPPLPLEIFMKVKIITDRKPWADGKKWHMGDGQIFLMLTQKF